MKTQQNMINIRIQQPINRHNTQWNVGNHNMIMQQQMNKNAQQQNIQQKMNILKNLNPQNCKTQHIADFFNKNTIEQLLQKNQTIHPLCNNAREEYLKWFSDYVDKMYYVINNIALDAFDKKKCWQEITGNGKEPIKFHGLPSTTLESFIKTDFLNRRNPLNDGHKLINDTNELMRYLAQCSLKICNGKLNIYDINKVITTYNLWLTYLSENPKAFVDRSILGFGTDRDNAWRGVVNKHVKVKNLKDLAAGIIGLVV